MTGAIKSGDIILKAIIKLVLLLNILIFSIPATPREKGWERVTIQAQFLTVTLRSVYTVGLDFAVVVGDSGTILKTIDGGTTWSTPSSGTKDDLLSVFFPNEKLGFAVGGLFNSHGTVIKTTDGGDTWTAQEGVAANLLFSTIFVDDSLGFAGGVNGTLIGTGDGGKLWTPLQSGTSNWLLDFNHFEGDTIPPRPVYAVGGNGTIIQNDGTGSIWTPQNSGTSDWLTSVAFVDDSFGVAVGNVGTIIGTLDRGGNWQPWSSGTQLDLTDVTYLNNTTAISVGHNGTILSSLDLGISWTPQQSPTLKNLLGVSFFNNDFGMAVGDSGIVLVTHTGGVVVSVEENAAIEIPAGFLLHQNYPNPFNPETVIKYQLRASADVELAIYNLLGQRIRLLLSQNQPDGFHQIKWHGTDDAGRAVSSGVYFYELRAGDVRQTKKMLLLQ